MKKQAALAVILAAGLFLCLGRSSGGARIHGESSGTEAREAAPRFSASAAGAGQPDGAAVRYAIGSGDEIARIENQTLTSNKRYDFIRSSDDLRNIIVECRARWSGAEADEYHVPEISFSFLDDGRTGSGWYMIGEKDCTVHQQWRMPPFPGLASKAGTNHFKIAVDVPKGLTLTIEKLIVRYDDACCRPFSGLRIDTHLNFMGFPAHSVHAFNAAARCGASYCIVIPKISSDGVWFAYHDDTFDEKTTLLRNADGTKIAGSGFQGKRFDEIPWTWLKTLDSGVYRGKIFAGTRLMTIETFFDLCNRTGVHPVFSIHPDSTREQAESLYAMAKKYNVLDKLTLLPGAGEDWFVRTWYPVFGNEVEMYKLRLPRKKETPEALRRLIDAVDRVEGLDRSRICIAFWADHITPEMIDTTLGAGYRVGIHQYQHMTPSGRITDKFSAADYRYYQKLGVTVFTDGYNASMGLNW